MEIRPARKEGMAEAAVLLLSTIPSQSAGPLSAAASYSRRHSRMISESER